MLRARYDLEVCRPVVALVAVNVVDLPAGVDFASNFLFSDPPVGKHPLPGTIVLELLVAVAVGSRTQRSLPAAVRSDRALHGVRSFAA